MGRLCPQVDREICNCKLGGLGVQSIIGRVGVDRLHLSGHSKAPLSKPLAHRCGYILPQKSVGAVRGKNRPHETSPFGGQRVREETGGRRDRVTDLALRNRLPSFEPADELLQGSSLSS